MNNCLRAVKKSGSWTSVTRRDHANTPGCAAGNHSHIRCAFRSTMPVISRFWEATTPLLQGVSERTPEGGLKWGQGVDK